MTTFTMEMMELKKKVNFVRNGMGSSKVNLPVMLISMALRKDKLVMFTFDNEMFCRVEAKVTNVSAERDPFHFAVMGNKLEKLISQVDAETVVFSVDDENLEVKVGFLTVNFELFDGAMLNTVQAGLEADLKLDGLVVPTWVLIEGLACAKSCQTTHSIRQDITHVEMRGGKILSSDGRKIMIYSTSLIPDSLQTKVPGSTLTDMAVAVKHIEAEHVQLYEGKSYYFFRAGKSEYALGVRKVDRIFPKVEEQVKTMGDAVEQISIDKNVLEGMLRGVALGLPSDEVGVKMTVNGTGQEAYLEVSAKNSVGRTSFERASCGRKGTETVAVPVSFKHILDTVAVFKGDSVVDMAFMTDKSVLMVYDKIEEREIMTVIPFRTQKAVEEEERERNELKAKKQTVKEETTEEEIDLGEAAEVDA